MKFDFFINGRLGHETDKTYSVYCKADQSVITEVPDASEADIDAAVAAARAALPVWRRVKPVDRCKMVARMAELMRERVHEVTEYFGKEEGLPRNALAGSISFHSDLWQFYAGIGDKQYGGVLEHEGEYLNYFIREPLGVIACMLAWNTPLGSFSQKAPPALLGGNTVVVRAPDEAPLAVLWMGTLAKEAGFPDGVINIVAGLGGESGAYLVRHPEVDGVSFTGSVVVGRKIAEACAPTFKRSVLELGGKSPFIICADADLEHAAACAVQAAFAYQGQGCSAVSRVLIEASVHDEVLARMVKMVESYQPALPDTPVSDAPHIGPMFNKRQMERTLEFVALAKREARLLAGGFRVEDPPFDKGYYLQPAICSLEDTDSDLFMEEIFGPLLTVVSFKDEAHAIALANKCNFALSASVWSKDFGKARGMAEAIRFGTVWTNNHLCFSHHSPWGGFKNSGWDREFGIDAIESFTEVKSIWLHP